ncbi:MAG: S41 family peptidase [Polyangiaceae bacterium]|nr:S41 family peptidase [Polyangiaceae bacterium]
MKWTRLLFGSVLIPCALGCAPAAIARDPAEAPAIPAASPGPRLAAQAREPRGPDGPITPALRAETIDGLLRVLADKYVFPEKAQAALKSIKARQKRGAYDTLTTGHALAKALTSDINEIFKDAHFHVQFNLEALPPREKADKPSPEELRRGAEFEREVNGGFERVERLPGNIGYVEVRSFGFAVRGYEAAAAAMKFVAKTDALILDIRRNGGGDPEMVAALCSYFFAEPVHLNDLYFRPDDTTRQYWTFQGVPAEHYLGRDVYVLTSKKTGSGAEEFAYNLKNLKRATIVGEVTWGGAHPGDVFRLNDHFSAFVPTGRAINPITKTNWEGVGVKPDVEVPAEDALRIAQIRILEKRIPLEKDPERRKRLEERLRDLSQN